MVLFHMNFTKEVVYNINYIKHTDEAIKIED